VTTALRRAWGSWQQFFFEPQPTSTLAIFRIAFGLVVTAWTLTQLPYLFDFYGPQGILPTPPKVGPGQWGLLNMVTSVPAVAMVWMATLLAAVALTIGMSPRIAAIVVLLGIMAFERRNPELLNSGDVLLRVMAVYLVFAPSGAALSWDRWRNDRATFWEFPLRAPWAMRMLQIQLSVLYLAAVWAKMQGNAWSQGTAVSFALRMLDQTRFPPPSFVSTSVLLTEWFTFGTLIIELAIGVLVWNRRARPWVLGLGALMHLGIEITIMVGFFSIAMWCFYLVFVPPETAARWVLAGRDRWRRLRRGTRNGTPAAPAAASVTQS
jgi:hypothetical protein